MTLLAGPAIAKPFGSRLILDGAELSVEPQARIGVVGPNGSGTVVASSHDRYFLDRVANRVVEVDGSVRATEGGYSAWLERETAAAG